VAIRTFLHWLGEALSSDDGQRNVALALSYAAVLSACLWYLPSQVAPLHPVNRDLLWAAQSIGRRPTAEEVTSPEGQAVADVAPPENALRIHDLLRSDTGKGGLQSLYARQIAVLLLLLYGLLVLERWRKAIKKDRHDVPGVVTGSERTAKAPSPHWMAVTDRVLRPALCAVLVAILVTLPANYGVLGMSTDYPCVQLTVNRDGTDRMVEPGYLWSDLSADISHIVILDRERNKYKVHYYPVESLVSMDIAPCAIRSIVAQ
jgi:hypothetical protein